MNITACRGKYKRSKTEYTQGGGAIFYEDKESKKRKEAINTIGDKEIQAQFQVKKTPYTIESIGIAHKFRLLVRLPYIEY